MKYFKLILIGGLLFSIINLSAQNRSISEKDKQAIMSLPELKLPVSYKNRSIPHIKNNAEEIFFRDVFQQAGMSCGQASSVGLGFNYEINCVRNVAADHDTAKYPTHFVYNWESDTYYGVSYYHTYDVLRLVGTPNLQDYGGTNDAGGTSRWMTGYDLYYNAMKNRIRQAYKIDVSTEEGMLTLKHWMNDHLNGSPHGGVANFYNGVPSASYTLPAGTPDEGMYVVPSMYGGTSHAMTVVGYHDSICYDYNSDGQYTNNIDINSDGVVNMKDWEIGGVKIANTYSGGPSFANGGFIYVMYKTIAEGGFWNGIVTVQDAIPNYEPQITAKAEITYNKRSRIKVSAGISSNPSATHPEFEMEFPIIDYQCGDQFMTGGTAEQDKTIEFGLDLTPLLNYIEPGDNASYFLCITENDSDETAEGTVNYFSVMDYTTESVQEIPSTQENITIIQNGKTILSTTHACNFDPPQISTNIFPPAPLFAPFSEQLEAENGTEPYFWEFNPDFQVEESTTSLSSGGTSINGSVVPVNLSFDFPFYDSTYSTIYVSNTGIISFDDEFTHDLPYNNDDDIVFSHSRCIAPFYNSNTSWDVKKENGLGYITLNFDNTSIDFSVNLFESGVITFTYGNANTSQQQIYVCGVSKGDNKTMQKIFFEDMTNIPEGYTRFFTPYTLLDEFEISENGLLTGTPSILYTGEEIHLKVTDNNGLVDTKSIPIISEGLTFEISCNTTDGDTIIEYSENVLLSLLAHNPMEYEMTNISLELESSDPYITITDANENIPDINPEGTENISDAFSFNVSGSIPDQHEISLNLNTTCDQGNYNYPIVLIGNAPNITITNINIQDGNDGFFAASESGTINLNINNSGGANLNNIDFLLTNSETSLIINDANTQLISLTPNTDSIIQFGVESNNSIPQTEINHLNIYATADNGFEQNIEMDVSVYAPEIDLLFHQIMDGENSSLDAGETTDISFMLKNSELIPAENLDIQITCNDPLATINDGIGSISLIDADGTAAFLTNVSISESIPDGYMLTFIISVQNSTDYETEISANIPVGILVENYETGDLSQFDWETVSASSWFVTDQEMYEGEFSLQSGPISNNEDSRILISFDVTNPGEITFARKVSSQTYYDFLDFIIDGQVQESWSGDMNWEVFSYSIDVGYHEFEWRYRKDFETSTGQDAAWIDSIVFPPMMNIPPQIQFSTNSIEKGMYPNSTDQDTIIISNAGGGHLHYDMWLELNTSGKSVKNIEGSEITFSPNTYINGENSITATVNNTSSDSEWIKTININFPGGTEIISSTDFTGGTGGSLNTNGETGLAAEIEWTCDGWGNIYGGETGSAEIVFNVSDGMSNDLVIPYSIYGDIYGSEPHEVQDEVILSNADNQWIDLNHFEADLYFENDTNLILNFNTTGMEPGFYNARIDIFHNDGHSEIPIVLQILNPASITDADNSNIYIFPNPAKNQLNIHTFNQEINSVRIVNMQGKTIFHDNPMTQSTVIQIPKNWSNGLYLIEIETERKSTKQKLTIFR
ncbi:MAG: T9SS type A sorting domain-containing protein [Bacteroidota bacterium]|nr:T9SS type A sorting domain-containing protein [Bacteroidota bacterium]